MQQADICKFTQVTQKCEKCNPSSGKIKWRGAHQQQHCPRHQQLRRGATSGTARINNRGTVPFSNLAAAAFRTGTALAGVGAPCERIDALLITGGLTRAFPLGAQANHHPVIWPARFNSKWIGLQILHLVKSYLHSALQQQQLRMQIVTVCQLAFSSKLVLAPTMSSDPWINERQSAKVPPPKGLLVGYKTQTCNMFF